MPAPSSMVDCISERRSAMRSVPSGIACHQRRRSGLLVIAHLRLDSLAVGGWGALDEFDRRRPACPCAEDQALGQGVRSQAVGAVEAHARAPPPPRTGPADRSRPVDVGMDAAHHVVHHRTHRNQLVHRIQIGVLQTQLAHERKPLVDHLLANLSDVEIDVVTVRPLQRAAPVLLLNERLRKPVARTELHRPLCTGFGSGLPRS